MKLLLVSTFGPEPRGISYYSDCLLRALCRHDGIEVETLDYASIYPSWLHPAGRNERSQGPNRTIHYAKPGTWVLRDKGADVIHLQSWTFATAWMHRHMLKEAKKLGIPTVLTVHNPASHEGFGLLTGLERSLVALADRVVIHDAAGADSIPRACHSKLSVIHHGTEEKNLGDSKLSGEIVNAPYVLYFGNIRPYKGVDTLLAAWRRIDKAYPFHRLVIAGRLWQGNTPMSKLVSVFLGTGRYARSIVDRKEADSDLKVEFRFGFIEDDELDRLINGAAYCVFPYERFSGQSGAVSRAAAQGVPILVTDAGGLKSLAIDETYVCRKASVEGLAHLLDEKLKQHKMDLTERRLQLRKAHEMGWSQAAQKHVVLYREMLGLPETAREPLADE